QPITVGLFVHADQRRFVAGTGHQTLGDTARNGVHERPVLATYQAYTLPTRSFTAEDLAGPESGERVVLDDRNVVDRDQHTLFSGVLFRNLERGDTVVGIEVPHDRRSRLVGCGLLGPLGQQCHELVVALLHALRFGGVITPSEDI